jgi:hypothetical protein
MIFKGVQINDNGQIGFGKPSANSIRLADFLPAPQHSLRGG